MESEQEYESRGERVATIAVAYWLRRARQAHGWSQQAVADLMTEAGVPMRQQGVHAIETGSREPTFLQAVALAAVVGVPVAAITAPGELKVAMTQLEVATQQLAAAEAAVAEKRAARDACAARVLELESRLGDLHPPGVELPARPVRKRRHDRNA